MLGKIWRFVKRHIVADAPDESPTCLDYGADGVPGGQISDMSEQFGQRRRDDEPGAQHQALNIGIDGQSANRPSGRAKMASHKADFGRQRRLSESGTGIVREAPDGTPMGLDRPDGPVP